MTDFLVREGDVATVPSDLLLLKHAQGFFGADKAVAARLVSAKVCGEADLRVAPGDFLVVESHGAVAPRRVLFLGTPPLRSFTYDEMRAFAQRAIETIAGLDPPPRTITTTVHGTGYGLDGGEALQRLVLGFTEGLAKSPHLAIERVTFLTLGKRAERMLAAALDAMNVATAGIAKAPATDEKRTRDAAFEEAAVHAPAREPDSARPLGPAGAAAVGKPCIFVAMPFAEEFENVYEFGIYPAVRRCGYICERVDEAHFTGDVLDRIRKGIAAASFVIADLTDGRPNVYLEVGYAWGRGVPVIFVAKKGTQLHFDVSTHRCVFYGKFAQFAKDLEELIRGIEASRSA